jgi:hypothetical protein
MGEPQEKLARRYGYRSDELIALVERVAET